jgi:hypothetical protein
MKQALYALKRTECMHPVRAGTGRRLDGVTYMRNMGIPGGRRGGRGGASIGSIGGDIGILRLNGVMMMGGMAGGAEGGFLCPAASTHAIRAVIR